VATGQTVVEELASLKTPDHSLCSLRRPVCRRVAVLSYVLGGQMIGLCEEHWAVFAGLQLEMGLTWLQRRTTGEEKK
jgi:hypothetical protein